MTDSASRTRRWQDRVLAAACPAAPEEDIEVFRTDWCFGVVARGYRPDDLESEVRRLLDPRLATRTLHWGRNYLYLAELRATGRPVPVVVKQFRHHRAKERWRRLRRGSKAARSFRAARALAAAGIGTPEPVMLIESVRTDGPSFFVARYLADAVEARSFLAPLRSPNPGAVVPTEFLRDAAELCRRMHDAGFWHRDLSSGNILIAPGAGLFLTDLNRMRIGRRMPSFRRMRDMGRLEIRDPRALDVFLAAYCRGTAEPVGWLKYLYLAFSYAFLAKCEARKPFKRAWGSVHWWFVPPGRGAHLSIDPKPRGRADLLVWDPLRAEPHLALSPARKLGLTLAHPVELVRNVRAVAAAALPVARRYRELCRGLHASPVVFDGIGIGVFPRPEEIEPVLAAVEDLGVGRVLLRLHAWEGRQDAASALAAELHGRGVDLVFAIAQNRDLATDLGRWRSALTEIAERFRPYGQSFVIGHAINRFKWGVWSVREYRAMAEIACEVLRRHPPVIVAGPAVIDFEFHVALAALQPSGHSYSFDVVSALLYVDRRGAPENRQLGFDAEGKAVLLRAVAETAAAGASRCWITETNWPLPEGPHAPAGRDLAVTEADQARFLARHFILTLGTGLVERMYWWELMSRGCGLMDAPAGTPPRKRPSYRAIRTLIRQLQGARIVSVGKGPRDDVRAYRFDREGNEILVVWSPAGPGSYRLPGKAVRVVGLEGEERPVPDGLELPVTPAPQYVMLED